MSSLSSYLASKYLNADSSSSKKRKRKTPKDASSGLIIADDDDSSWVTAASTNAEDDSPLMTSTNSAEFRKAKKNAWKTVGSAAPSNSDLADSLAADQIIASAAAENAAASHVDEEPVIEDAGDDEIVKMGDGTHAGLQSASAVAAQMEKRSREERLRWEAEEASHGRSGRKSGKASAEETVYRDATGRRIDISMRRAEARKELDEKERKEREEREAQKGDVQRENERKRREELEEAKFMPLARGVDDEGMNRELRERERWNDPAAAFLTEKKSDTGGAGGGAGIGTGGGKGGKKTYQGAAQPNRYGIRPGYRWDGVDRGNGWEGERFKTINRKKRNKDLEFAWQMDT